MERDKPGHDTLIEDRSWVDGWSERNDTAVLSELCEASWQATLDRTE